MRERALVFGGSLEITNDSDKGAKIILTVPKSVWSSND